MIDVNHPNAANVDVFLFGRKVKFVTAADPDEGWVRMFLPAQEGTPIFDHASDNFVEVTAHGVVEVVPKGTRPTYDSLSQPIGIAAEND